jgi:selenocysteine-specific elongation factor
MSEHLIIGTAGHIDHGKTSLIRAITGVDLDRLPEERERGITIALGFTHLTLDSGRTISFIDVPGHERLVRTMIAGATGLDAAMLCVSAVEGVMPQTREHLAILELLGVRQGIIALTMTDLVDEEMLELAEMDIEEAIEGTPLQGAPILRTSAGPQPAGIDDILAALEALTPRPQDLDSPFRLPIDRAFVRRGFGTVITGTTRSGSIEDGAEVVILPEGTRARIRGIQVHGVSVTHADAGQRTAINLAGIERDDLARGMTLALPDALPPAHILDARYHHLADAPEIPHDSRVRLLVGTSEVMAVLSVLDDEALQPGQSHLIQLRTDAPLVTLPRDRFVLRRESPVQTLGGGVLLDPWAGRLRRKHHAQAIAHLSALEAGDTSVLLLRAGEDGLTPQLAGLYGLSESPLLGGLHFHPDIIASLRATLLTSLRQWHDEHPLAAGVGRRDLRRGVFQRMPERVYIELLEALAADGAVVFEGPRLRASDFAIRLTPAQRKTMSDLTAAVLAAGLEGPRFDVHVKECPELLQLLLEDGTLVRVGPHLIHSEPLGAMKAQVIALLAEKGELLPTDFKDLTGLSRRFAIPLLEWLDAQRITVRRGDVRVAPVRTVSDQ